MPARGRLEPVTTTTDLKEIRCAGRFRDKPCGRILLRATSQPVKPGAVIEIKCGKCEQVSYIVGGPTT